MSAVRKNISVRKVLLHTGGCAVRSALVCRASPDAAQISPRPSVLIVLSMMMQVAAK